MLPAVRRCVIPGSREGTCLSASVAKQCNWPAPSYQYQAIHGQAIHGQAVARMISDNACCKTCAVNQYLTMLDPLALLFG
jgi:hypothetical protein